MRGALPRDTKDIAGSSVQACCQDPCTRPGAKCSPETVRTAQGQLREPDTCSARPLANTAIQTQKYRATAVVLLIAPEHLTAANIRKRYLVQLEQQRSPDLSEALRYEIKFLDSLFTSPLHRHTKSPTLWSHRRWLVTHFDHDLQPLLRTLFKMPLRHGDVVQKDEASAEELGNRDLVSSLLKQEFEVVQKAGQQHPRNYVAYDYMRYITTLCVSHGADLDRMPAISVSENPSDTSSVSFVEFRLHLLDHSSSASQATDIRTRLVHHVIQDTIEKALQYRWRSEAVWSLVRVALSSTNAVGLPERQRRKFLEALKEWLETYVLDEKHDSLEEHTLGDVRAIAKTRLHGQVEKTVQWIEKWWEA